MKSLGWTLIQHYCYTYQKGKNWTERQAERPDIVKRHGENMSVRKPRRGAWDRAFSDRPQKGQPSQHLGFVLLVFRKWSNRFLLSEPLSLWVVLCYGNPSKVGCLLCGFQQDKGSCYYFGWPEQTLYSPCQ